MKNPGLDTWYITKEITQDVIYYYGKNPEEPDLFVYKEYFHKRFLVIVFFLGVFSRLDQEFFPWFWGRQGTILERLGFGFEVGVLLLALILNVMGLPGLALTSTSVWNAPAISNV